MKDEVFRLLSERLSQYDAAIEIGANVGHHGDCPAFSRRGQGHRQHCGIRARGEFLCPTSQNLELNGAGAVRVVQAAVSDRDGEAPRFTVSAWHATRLRWFVSRAGPLALSHPDHCLRATLAPGKVANAVA